MTSDVVPDAPEADVQEQSRPVTPPVASDPPNLDPEVPEADALEQAQAVPYDEADETPS